MSVLGISNGTCICICCTLQTATEAGLDFASASLSPYHPQMQCCSHCSFCSVCHTNACVTNTLSMVPDKGLWTAGAHLPGRAGGDLVVDLHAALIWCNATAELLIAALAQHPGPWGISGMGGPWRPVPLGAPLQMNTLFGKHRIGYILHNDDGGHGKFMGRSIRCAVGS